MRSDIDRDEFKRFIWNHPGYKIVLTKDWDTDRRKLELWKEVISSLKRIKAAFEADDEMSPNMPILVSVETNHDALREATEILTKAAELDGK